MTEREHVPRPFLLPAVVALVCGLSAFLVSLHAVPVALSVELGLLLAAALLSENYAVALRGFLVSLAFPLVIATALLYGPGAAGLIAAMTFTNLSEIRARRPGIVLAFNLGQVLLWGTAGGWVFQLLGGELLGVRASSMPLSSGVILRAGLPLLGAAVASTAVNFLLAGLGVSILKQIPYPRVIRGVLEYAPTHLALAFVGFLIALVLLIQPIAFPLFLFPLFLARQVFQRYSVLKEAYLDTVRSLVGALEAKDPYTKGHSERVSAYAEQAAVQLRLEDGVIESVRQAALLHDIGKLALSTQLLVKPTALSEPEIAKVRQHPATGGAMITRIPALRSLSTLVQCHHERLDGSGYPNGISGENIPFEARILSVADAYDAMTTKRSYREAMSRKQAIAELLAGAGTQFDAEVVRAFIACQAVVAGGESPDELDEGALSPEFAQ